MMASQEQQKQEQMQHFLYEEIIQQGYDGDKFGEYLQQKNPSAAADLTSITYEELSKITAEFKLAQNPPQIMQSNYGNNNSNNILNMLNQPDQDVNSEFAQPQKPKELSGFPVLSKTNPSSFAINKTLAQAQGQQGNLTASQFGKQNSSSLPSFNNNMNESILNSTFTSSRVLRDTQGQTIVRKEVQIIPETSMVKDTFVKKNIEGEECSKVISCRKMESSKISDFKQQQQDALDQYNKLIVNLQSKSQMASQVQTETTPTPDQAEQEENKSQQNEEKTTQNIISNSVVITNGNQLPRKPKLVKLIVKVEKYDVIGEGLFSQDYALYEVKTPCLNWVVQRRYSDFEWLYNSLKRFYPGRFVPPIAKKTTIKDTSGKHLYERMRTFEYFLNELLASPALSLSTELSDFLSVTDQKAFEGIRKQTEQKPSPGIIDEISTINGELVSEITPGLKDFWSNFNDLSQKSLLNYQQLNESIAELIETLTKAGEQSSAIALQFSRMHKAHEIFNKLSPIGKIPSLETLNVHMNNFFLDFSSTQCALSLALERNLFELTRYRQLMIEEFSFIVASRETYQNDYLEKLKKLQSKKEKLFNLPNTAKWELDIECEVPVSQLQVNKIEAFKYMLPTETKQIQAQGEYFGFLNKNLFEDVTLHQQISKDTACTKGISLTQDIALEINKLHMRIADSNTVLSDLLGKDNSSLNLRNREEE